LLRLARGESVACVSDAGTPAVSDPGAVLVAAATAAGHTVVPLPGPSSALAALSVAGDAQRDGRASGFIFVGFVPAKGGERREALHAVLAEHRTQVLFEAPHRIGNLLDALAVGAPARPVTLCRELTKQFETIATMPALALPGWLAADANRERGEFVLVLHALPAPVAEEGVLPEPALRTLRVLLRELPLKQAVSLAAELSGAPRNALYQRALLEKQGGPDAS
jgi:16S rRNA (cytidine1402-2'-O)-methyltransferase